MSTENINKLTTLEQLRLLAVRVHAEDEALGARIDAHIEAIENAGYQNADQVSAAVSDAVAQLSIGDYAKAETVETLQTQVAAILADYLTSEDKYDDSALVGRVEAVEGEIETLVGEDEGKSVRTIAVEELAKQLIPENAGEALDSLAEIAAWIQSHPDDASAMNLAIAKLEAIVDGIGGEGEKATVVAYVDDAIAALKAGDMSAAIEALEARIEALEAIDHDAYIAADVQVLAEARDYVDGMVCENIEVESMLTEVFGAAE